MDQFLNEDHEKIRRLSLQMLGAGTVVLGVALYMQHRKILDAAIKAQQNLQFDCMWESFDEGVKYGLKLAKEHMTPEAAAQATESVFDQYFGAKTG